MTADFRAHCPGCGLKSNYDRDWLRTNCGDHQMPVPCPACGELLTLSRVVAVSARKIRNEIRVLDTKIDRLVASWCASRDSERQDKVADELRRLCESRSLLQAVLKQHKSTEVQR